MEAAMVRSNPASTTAAVRGQYCYFVSGDFLRNDDLGIESPDGSSNPIHDHTTQYHGFGYFEDILDDENRIALMLGARWAGSRFPT